MNIKLSQKQIGQRIAALRKMKGFSQEDLAKSVKISRPSLAQIELGNRSVDILELQKLSWVLKFSLDDFMSKDFSTSQEIEGKEEKISNLKKLFRTHSIVYNDVNAKIVRHECYKARNRRDVTRDANAICEHFKTLTCLSTSTLTNENVLQFVDNVRKNAHAIVTIERAQKRNNAEKKEERISVPTLQVNKFKNVLLYILERCAGKPNVGETVLYKLLYFSDFNHYELHEEHLTGATYRKLPYGPVPQKFDTIINQMIDKGQLQRVKTEYHGYPQTRYLPLEKADLTELMASEKEIIDRVIEQMSEWSAAAISNYSHKDLPWEVTDEGQDINYELTFYREHPYSVRNYGDEIEEQ